MVLPGDAAETDEFLEKFQTAFDPPPLIFGKSCWGPEENLDPGSLENDQKWKKFPQNYEKWQKIAEITAKEGYFCKNDGRRQKKAKISLFRQHNFFLRPDQDQKALPNYLLHNI